MPRPINLLALLLILLATASAVPAAADNTNTERGHYLTTIGNCAGCHTAPGGQAFAGGLRLASDYGTFITPNITPDDATGIGRWNEDDFWAALHEGQRADGSPMYPACPYPDFTHVGKDDVATIFAYLQSVPAVRQQQPGHDLGFPYRYRSLVNLWQALYFNPQPLPNEPKRSDAWQRGRYLVEGLGHCDACHRARGMFGARRQAADAPGAVIRGWYAPPLADPRQAGFQRWPVEEAARFLRVGRTEHAAVMGPMADVVFDSLQHLTGDDAIAIATYLKTLPPQQVASPERLLRLSEDGRQRAMATGKQVYVEQCASCHGDDGKGGDGAPALAGNRAVTLAYPLNVANIIRLGGFAPATAGNPRPHGMPPFYDLSDRELASVISYIRGSWGNDAAPVTATNLRR